MEEMSGGGMMSLVDITKNFLDHFSNRGAVLAIIILRFILSSSCSKIFEESLEEYEGEE